MLKEMSRREGVTMFMMLLAIFKTLLYHYTKQVDISVGTPVAGRKLAETEGIIGLFINTLVLRTDFDGNPGFREILRRIRSVTLGAMAHQDLPFEKLVEELQPDRDAGSSPFFRVWFVLQNAPMPPLELSGLSMSPLESEQRLVRHDLRLGFTEDADGISGSLEYRAELFYPETISRLIRHFETLLLLVVVQPDISLNEIETFLIEADRRRDEIKEKEFKQTSHLNLKTARRKSFGALESKQAGNL
jgi:non-ribosomal peptide synthetase component F